MAVPVSQMWTVATYVLRQKLAGRKRYPLVLMLEPLFRCNLACAGCGKIQYPAHILKTDLSPEDCFKAVDECGAPDGLDPRRRAADASADRRNRRRPGRAQEIYLSLHQRAAAERKVAPVQAQQVPELLGPRGRTERAPRFLRLPRRRIRYSRSTASAQPSKPASA